jgi:hypothetical protein
MHVILEQQLTAFHVLSMLEKVRSGWSNLPVAEAHVQLQKLTFSCRSSGSGMDQKQT